MNWKAEDISGEIVFHNKLLPTSDPDVARLETEYEWTGGPIALVSIEMLRLFALEEFLSLRIAIIPRGTVVQMDNLQVRVKGIYRPAGKVCGGGYVVERASKADQ